MDQLSTVLVTVIVLAVLFALLRRGWRTRVRRQSGRPRGSRSASPGSWSRACT